MKYPWVSMSIIGVWLGSAIAIWAREDISVEKILLIADHHGQNVSQKRWPQIFQIFA